MVSVICDVYNHERYLRQTFEGFVKQIVDFDFEVLVHDDASTDNSVAIIQEYEKKYPGIIKPIYQKENQYSKGISILRSYTLPRVKGKYIAVCEGDDYWIDEYKLSKQVKYMENHPDCTFCFTNGIIENVQNGKQRPFIPYTKGDIVNIKANGIYDVVEISKLSFLPTCSFLYPARNFELYPDYYWEKCFSGDRKASLYATSLGYAYCLNDLTCCYHYAVAGSAMTRKKTKKQIALIERTYVQLYDRINQFTNFQFDDFFKAAQLPYLKWIYMLQGNEPLLSSTERISVENSLSFIDRCKKAALSIISDTMLNFIRDLKRKMGG